MAVHINTGNLTTPQYNTYKLERFNGVDYTTTPTSVDGTRAIDMSNYLPYGNSLVKRYGTTPINLPTNERIVGIFEFNRQVNTYANRLDYKRGVLIFTEVVSWKKRLSNLDVYDIELHAYVGDSVENAKQVEMNVGIIQDMVLADYDYETYRNYKPRLVCKELENRLWILGYGKYMMVKQEQFNDGDETYKEIVWLTEIDYTNAYIPTLLLNVGTDKAQTNSVYFEATNLLSDRVKVEVTLNPLEAEQETDFTDLLGYNPELVSVITKISDEEIEDFEDIEIDDGLYCTITKTGTNEGYVFTIDKPKALVGGQLLSLVKLTLVLEYSSSNDSTAITNMTNMETYGARESDTIFFTGNPNLPNLEMHTSTENVGKYPWEKYTYVPDDSYQTYGDSTTSIIGSGVLSNGDMVIVKESNGNKPNVYVKTAEYYTETIPLSFTYYDAIEGQQITKNLGETTITKVRYRVFPSGCYVNATTDSKLVYYDNKLFICNQDGIYNIVLGENTATQTYQAYEYSYTISANLSKDIKGCQMFVFEDRLWVYRRDINNNYRIYVADKARYLYHEDKKQYEWWVLDGITIDNVEIVNSKLYFGYNNALYKYGDNGFVDTYITEYLPCTIGTLESNPYFQFDTDYEKVIMSPNTDVMRDLANAKDSQQAFKNFKEQTSFTLSNVVVTVPFNTRKSTYRRLYPLRERINGIDVDYTYQLHLLLDSKSRVIFGEGDLKYDHYTYEFATDELGDFYYEMTYYTADGSVLSTLIEIFTTGTLANNVITRRLDEKITKLQFIYNGEYRISEIYTKHEERYIPFSKCTYNDGWYFLGFNDDEFVYLGNDILFNCIEILIGNMPVNLASAPNDVQIRLKLAKVITSRWVSNFNYLERLDYLKTATNIYFVPEVRRGGKTHIGYRSGTKDVGMEVNALSNVFSFNDVNFNEFTFGKEEGASYSSRKKIKNFAFIQLVAYSDEANDSTLALISFRYKYSKSNKGVRQ